MVQIYIRQIKTGIFHENVFIPIRAGVILKGLSSWSVESMNNISNWPELLVIIMISYNIPYVYSIKPQNIVKSWK